MAWGRQYPVSTWEKEWNSRTAMVMGHQNPFITGDRSWTLGHKPSREGIVNQLSELPQRPLLRLQAME
jgi:deoxyribonuclease-1